MSTTENIRNGVPDISPATAEALARSGLDPAKVTTPETVSAPGSA